VTVMGRSKVKSLSPGRRSGVSISWVFLVAKLKTADRKSAGASGVLEAPV